jgi:hypothetical protein
MLRITRSHHAGMFESDYPKMLQNLAIAEASMIKTNSKALDHFIAIVKELEAIYNFKFEKVTQEQLDDENK